MVVSQRRVPFDPSGIVFDTNELSVVDTTTLVGLKMDNKMRWGPMVNHLAVKARKRIGAMSRVRHLLDSPNLKTIYLMFIRSIMEYNSVSWMGAAESHLNKLDRIQLSAQKIGSFDVESLQCSRRDAAALSLVEWKLPKYSNLFDTSTPAVQRFWPENSSLRESQFLLQTQTNQCSIATHQAFCSSTTMKNRHQLVTAICPDLAWAFPTAWGTIPQFECERVTNAAVRRATACRIPPEWLHTLFEPHGCTKFLAKR